MASEINSTASAKSANASSSSRRSTKVKQYVNQQLEKTRRQVKTTDLIGGVLTIVAFSLAFLLLVAIWDAWIWPLSVVGRWVCLGLLLSGCLVYAAVSILPLLMKKINPDYAAKMIEEAKPSFKNSLLNYVSLRRKSKSVNPAVFDAVSRQAATDLASVPSDATVDRSKLIRLGFVLIGVLAFMVGYKMLSPKDPLQTFGRILSPSAKIAKPAVVKISDVLPGDTKVFFGDQLEVTAVVRGRHDPQEVLIEYSTNDGQLVDQRISMVPEEVAGRYRANLAVAGNGIRQSLTYRVVARDGSSPDFEVLVQPNPTIAVESLVLTPPAYTGLPVRTLVGQGSIDVIEGTEAVVHAVANLPIKMAFIELLEEIGEPNKSSNQLSGEKSYDVIRPIEMKSEGQSAVVRFVAQLNASRKKPFATHYRIKFISEDDDRNQKPNIYPIRIKPDLAPEVVISNPPERDVYVAENGTVAIDVEANDLDFEIAAVTLHIDHQGAKLLENNLALKSSNGNQRVTARYLLKPDELRLKAGDKAIFFATASDNRTSPQSGQPDPNVSRTENFTLTVTEREKQPDQQVNQQNNQQQNEQRQPDKEQSGTDGEQNGSGADDESNAGQNSQDQQGAEGTNDSQSGSDQGDESGSQQMNAAEGQNESGQESGSDQESGNESGEEGGQSGGSQSAGESESGDENSQQSGSSQAGSGGEEQQSGEDQGSGAGSQSTDANDSSASGNNQTGEGSNSSGSNNQQSPSQDGAGRSSDGDQANQADSGVGQGQRDENLTDGQREPLSDDASEGEQFRRLQEMLENQQEKSPSEQNQSSGDNQPSSQSESGGEGSENQSQGGTDANQENSQNASEQETSGQDGQNQQQSSNETAQQNQADSTDPNSPQDNSGDQGSDQQSGNQTSNSSQAGDNATDQTSQSDSQSGSEGQSGESQSGSEGESGSQTQSGSDGQSGAQGESDSQGQSGESQSGAQGESGSQGQSSESQSGAQGESGSQGQSGSDGQSGSEDERGSQGQSAEGQGGSEGESGTEGQSGSASQSGSEGQRDSQNSGNSPSQGGTSGQSSSPSSEDQQSNQTSESSTQSSPAGSGSGGGNLSTEALAEEKANLEHSKKATDLILSKLNDQKYEPDPKLLEEMNWTQAELDQFLRRWQEMKQKAESGDVQAKAKYERALKSLGLRPKGNRRKVGQNEDEIKGLIQDNAVIQPPPDLAPDFNATLRDLNRVRDDD